MSGAVGIVRESNRTVLLEDFEKHGTVLVAWVPLMLQRRKHGKEEIIPFLPSSVRRDRN